MATAKLYKCVKSTVLKSGQKMYVYNAALKIGRPFKVAELVPLLKDMQGFDTTQTVERIAAYYVCVLKKERILEEASVEDTQSLSEFYSEWENEVGITR